MDDKITSEEMDKKITSQVTDRIRFLIKTIFVNYVSKTSDLKGIQSTSYERKHNLRRNGQD